MYTYVHVYIHTPVCTHIYMEVIVLSSCPMESAYIMFFPWTSYRLAKIASHL